MMVPLAQRRPGSPLANGNRLRLGIFGTNVSGGMACTTVPERWSPSWAGNVSVARMADAAGLEFMLPLGRWRGHGGSAAFQEAALDTMGWAAGVLAATTRIAVLSTVHAAFVHPVVAAKQVATLDAIGAGRYGLNLVCGWNSEENAMFGLDHLPQDSAARYAYGQEWLDFVRRILTAEAPFEWQGRWFKGRDIWLGPGPWGGTLPPIMNAGASETGREFGARNADACFVTMVDIARGAQEVASLRARARSAHGREVDVYTPCYVVCRRTTAEAEDYLRYYAVDHVDDEALDRLMRSVGLRSESFPPDFYAMFRTRFAAGHGGYPLVGDPDHVAAEMARIAEAGYAGLALTFVNPEAEFGWFRDEVLPRLAARGLRQRG